MSDSTGNATNAIINHLMPQVERTSEAPVMLTAEVGGTRHVFFLLKSIMEANVILEEYGCRALAGTEPGWRFDTDLPQQVRDEMRKQKMLYAITPNEPEGKLYFYSNKTLARKLKYLRPFSCENVEVDIGGKAYSYFMTNDENALNDFLFECKCLPPSEKDWKPNYALHKNVTDKMSALGAKYSVTLSHGARVLNRYDEGTPSIINIDRLAEKSANRLGASLLNCIIKNDDVGALKEYFETKNPLKNKPGYFDRLLVMCASHNSVKSAEFLIKLGLNLNSQYNHGITPLMVAAGKGSMEVVKLLLENGADRSIKADSGWTALAYALVHNHNDIAELLLEAKSNLDFHAHVERMQFHEKLGFFISRFISFGDQRPCDIYKNLRGYMTRKTFSKLRSASRHPKKGNVILLAIGMRLSMEDTEDLLMSAGQVFSPEDEGDQIIRKFIRSGNYEILEIDKELWNKTGRSLMRRE